jgi:hypothetical protein
MPNNFINFSALVAAIERRAMKNKMLFKIKYLYYKILSTDGSTIFNLLRYRCWRIAHSIF